MDHPSIKLVGIMLIALLRVCDHINFTAMHGKKIFCDANYQTQLN